MSAAVAQSVLPSTCLSWPGDARLGSKSQNADDGSVGATIPVTRNA
jgi:hypothetical protein